MDETKQYIKGKFKAKFSGEADSIAANQTFLADKLYKITLTKATVEEAVWIDAYEVEDRNDSLYEPYIAAVNITMPNDAIAQQKDFVHVWITNIVIENSVRKDNNSVGELSGWVHLSLPQRGQTPPKKEPKVVSDTPKINSKESYGCFGNLALSILSLLGLGALILLFWCFLFGHCSWSGLIGGCPECQNCDTKRDTVIIYRDTIKTVTDTTKPALGTGDLQFSLYWKSAEDLDLIVITPNGKAIYYQNKTADGGTMDVDMNASSQDRATNPVENIFWQTGKVPSGTYKCYVSYYKRYKDNTSKEDFYVKLKIKNVVQSFDGSLVEAFSDRNNGSFNPYHIEGERYVVKIAEFEYK